jgi:parvulin-like peptidyl-prolyl isomerase
MLTLVCRVIPLVVCAVLCASCSKPSASFVAQVGDETITEETFRAEAIRRSVFTEDARRALLEEMVSDLKLLQLARQKGYDKDPELAWEFRAKLISRARQDFGLAAEATQTAVTDADIQAYCDTHRQEFAVPARVRAAMIFVATPKGTNAETLAEKRKKVEAAKGAIEAAGAPAAANFGAIAVNFSEDQATRYVGGDIGYQVEGMANFADDKTAHAALFAMSQPGQLSDIVTGKTGFFLFKVIERTPPGVQPLAVVKERIRSKLQTARRQEKERAFTSTLAAMPARTRPEALAQIDLPRPHLADNQRTTPPAVPGGITKNP